MKLIVVFRATTYVGGLFLCLLLSWSSAALAEPFAPRAQIPAEITDNYLAKSVRDSAMPDQARVGIPAYPGAVMIRSFAVAERPPSYEGLPVIEMISNDDYDAVIAFYKKQLASWEGAELMSAHYFAQHGNINFIKPEEPHVGVHKLEKYFRVGDKAVLRQMLPGAQTFIKIFYAK